MYLRKDLVTIRKATINDANQLALWWSDGKVMSHAGFSNGLTIDQDKLKSNLANRNNDNVVCIIDYERKPIGECSFNIENNIAEVGIKICDFNMQDKGIGKIVFHLLHEYLFLNRNVNKIILDTNLKNIRAQRFYEGLGYQKKAVHLDSWKDQIEVLNSSIDYELTKEHYQKRIIIKFITNDETKKTYCEEILRDLPKWFGIESALKDYINNVVSQTFIAYIYNDECLGFISLEDYKNNSEIYVMGVKKSYHSQGIGKLLIEASLLHLKSLRKDYLCVKTISDSSDNKEYALTRAFYKKQGFQELIELPTLWDKNNPCTILIRKID